MACEGFSFTFVVIVYAGFAPALVLDPTGKRGKITNSTQTLPPLPAFSIGPSRFLGLKYAFGPFPRPTRRIAILMRFLCIALKVPF